MTVTPSGPAWRRKPPCPPNRRAGTSCLMAQVSPVLATVTLSPVTSVTV
jgi:hypothetical protein